jgi:phosphoribosylaminoimidazolecarboxamide formyltransferase/IMP cyclohydrolase
MADLFLEVIIAPQITESAKDILKSKKNLRVLITGEMPQPSMGGQTLKMLAGGYLLQDRDTSQVTSTDLKTVTKRSPSDQELLDLIFAFTVCKHVKSNAIVYAKAGATVGIGAGQMSRIDSCRIAAQKAIDAAEAAGESKPLTKGSVVASDAFFPFADGLLAAAAAGVTAVIQPGGSIRDDEVVAAADDNDLAMVLTGVRHFRH